MILLYLFLNPFVLAMVSGAASLAYRELRAHGETSGLGTRILRQYLPLAPRLFWTALCWIGRPADWIRGSLSIPVFVFEGKSGRAAVARSAELVRPFRSLALEIMIRMFAIAALSALYFPMVLAFGGAPLDLIKRMFQINPLARLFFGIVPVSLCIMFVNYAGGLTLIYAWARSACAEPLAEAVDSAASARALRPSKAKVWWAFVPLVVLTVAVLGQVRAHYDSKVPSLVDAASEGRSASVRRAIAAKESVNASGRGKRTPLMYAASWGDLETARLLVEAGAHVNAKDSGDQTPLHRAVAGKNSEIVRLLLSNKADVNAADEDGTTPLMSAVRSGQWPSAAMLLASGGDPNKKDEKGKSARDYAREEGNLEMMQLLGVSANSH